MDLKATNGSSVIVTLKIDQHNKREIKTLVSGQSLRIGRQQGNDLVVDDEKASRFHAIISASESGVVLSDLSSLNGTFVNRERVSTPISLASEDIILIGKTRIIVEISDELSSKVDDSLATQAIGLSQATVTILLADVCSYTFISEALPETVVANMLNAWFEKVSEIIRAHHGIVDKYIGDCVMAIWQSDDSEAASSALRAIKAAKEIRESTLKLSSSSLWSNNSDLYPWRTRISLNSGKALVGAIGAKGVRDFTVIGDTVNVAFRLDDVAGKSGYEIILAKDCADLLRTTEIVDTLVSLGSVKLEGRKEPVSIYTIS